MGLSAVNTKVWLAIIAVFVLAFLIRRARVAWVRRRARLATSIAASIRARNGRSRP